MYWVIQENLLHEDCFDELILALENNKVSFSIVKLLSFSDILPDIQTNKPIIIYGITSFVRKVYSQKKWYPGVFYNDLKLRPTYWLGLLGDKALNASGWKIALKDFVACDNPDEKLFFIRSNDDFKEISGRVQSIREFKEWLQSKTISIHHDLFVSRPVNIYKEWRLVVIDNRIITGSQYRENGRLSIDSFVPDRVSIEFALRIVRKELKDFLPAYTLDICESEQGLKVLELGCFNSAGFYHCDMDKIVTAINLL